MRLAVMEEKYGQKVPVRMRVRVREHSRPELDLCLPNGLVVTFQRDEMHKLGRMHGSHVAGLLFKHIANIEAKEAQVKRYDEGRAEDKAAHEASIAAEAAEETEKTQNKRSPAVKIEKTCVKCKQTFEVHRAAKKCPECNTNSLKKELKEKHDAEVSAG